MTRDSHPIMPIGNVTENVTKWAARASYRVRPTLAIEYESRSVVVNEANWERIGRLAAGVVLLILGFTAFGGILAVISVIAGLILTVTGAIGWCPIYSVLKIGTRKVTGA